MVHERPSGGTPAGLDVPGSATTTATIEPGTVFEIADRRPLEQPELHEVARGEDRAA
jgi:hypothetical protein